MSDITSSQLRAARAMVRWRAEDLARHSKVGVATIRRAEGTEGVITMTVANQAAIRAALADAGVIFVPANGEGPGVRLRKARFSEATEAEIIANAAVVRAQAADAVDDVLQGVDASNDEKGVRRRELTDEPAVIGKARKQMRPVND